MEVLSWIYRNTTPLFFVVWFVTTVDLILYTPWNFAPSIANALRNQADYDSVESGSYKNIYITFTGSFTLVLYMCVIHKLEDNYV